MARKQSTEENASRNRAWLRYVAPTLGAVVLVVAAMVSFQALERFLIDDPRFLLRESSGRRGEVPGLAVHGITHTPAARVRTVFTQDVGRSVYLLPLAERRGRLLELDWVREASVSRYWPNRIEVRIMERQPVAFVELPARRGRGPYQVSLIDEDGVFLDPPKPNRFSLPILIGVRREQPRDIRRGRVQRMLRLQDELGTLAEHVSEIDVSHPSNLRILMQVEDRAMALILGEENYLSRVQNFLSHYPEIRKRLPGATTLDLRLDDRITAVEEEGNVE